MKMTKSMKLMEKYAECLNCGNPYLQNGEGTLVIDETFKRTCKCGWSIEVDEDDKPIGKSKDEQFKEGQPVKHTKRVLHEARFAGYTKSGRIKVSHNNSHPYGVHWVTDTFNAENVVSDK